MTAMPALSDSQTVDHAIVASISRGVMVRVGGLNYSEIAAFGSSNIAAALREERRLAGHCASLGEGLTDALFDAISDPDHDQMARKALLSVKRDIYNGRKPNPAVLARCGELLCAPFTQKAREWSLAVGALECHRRDAAAVVAEVRAAGRAKLQSLLLANDFRLGLLASTPALESSLAKYAAAPAGPLNRKLRHVEEALLQFAYRTTCKTSPFSRLTLVCYGEMSDGAGPDMVPPLSSAIAAVVRPNLSLLGRLRSLIVQNLTAFPDIRVKSHGLRADTMRRLSYRRRVEVRIPHPGPIHATAREFSFSLTRTTALAGVVDLLEAGRDVSVRDLIAGLASAGLNGEQATAYIQRLAEKGFFQLDGLEIAVFDEGGWQKFATRLRDGRHAWLMTAAEAIDALLAGARVYATGGVNERRSVTAALEDRLDSLVDTLSPGERAPRPTFYEDATLSREPLAIGSDLLRSVAAKLPQVQRFLSLYDPLLMSRLTLKAMFLHQYGEGGECTDITAFSDLFSDRFYNAYTSARTSGGFGRGVVSATHAPEIVLVEQARERVREAIAQVSGEFEVELKTELVKAMGDLAAVWQPLLSNAFYLQFAGAGDRRKVVINRVYGGCGSSFSRFEGLFEDLDGSDPIDRLLQDNARALDRKRQLTAEFHGGYDTNLNQHALSTAAEILFPGERGAARSGLQIAVEELTMRHDADGDRMYLYCPRLECEVTPVYAGVFYPLALPELQTLLMHFSCPVHLEPDFFAAPEAGEKLFRPRVRWGDVVLSRGKWILAADDLPVRNSGVDDYGHISRYDAWRIATGLPQRCFAQVFADERISGPPAQKPFFVDFESPFSIDMLEKANLRRMGRVEFTELLPGPEDAGVFVEGEPRVAEFVVEVVQ